MHVIALEMKLTRSLILEGLSCDNGAVFLPSRANSMMKVDHPERANV
jgi:hypothetical protein